MKDEQLKKDAMVFTRHFLMEKYQLSHYYLHKLYGDVLTNNKWNNEKRQYVKDNYMKLGKTELIRRMGRKHKKNVERVIERCEIMNRNHDWYDAKQISRACEQFFKQPDNLWNNHTLVSGVEVNASV